MINANICNRSPYQKDIFLKLIQNYYSNHNNSRGCFLTSSLTATISVGLTVPMTAAADVIFKDIAYPALFYAGVVPTLASFIVVTALTRRDGRDPLLELLGSMCKRHRSQR